ncbi:hypothetical protein U9M48_023117 [Paspalum notatum var. saurae]|uniref:Uncharacterized protein n=1 Tax=Paspalum notatum var. saurae TaxID=547442 RepID=A0AAQ3WUS9_PASNO
MKVNNRPRLSCLAPTRRRSPAGDLAVGGAARGTPARGRVPDRDLRDAHREERTSWRRSVLSPGEAVHRHVVRGGSFGCSSMAH